MVVNIATGLLCDFGVREYDATKYHEYHDGH